MAGGSNGSVRNRWPTASPLATGDPIPLFRLNRRPVSSTCVFSSRSCNRQANRLNCRRRLRSFPRCGRRRHARDRHGGFRQWMTEMSSAAAALAGARSKVARLSPQRSAVSGQAASQALNAWPRASPIIRSSSWASSRRMTNEPGVQPIRHQRCAGNAPVVPLAPARCFRPPGIARVHPLPRTG